MSRANLAMDFGSTRTVTLSNKTLAPAPYCAKRAKLAKVSIEGLGAASAFLLFTGAGASVAASCKGIKMGRSTNLAGDL